MKLPSESSIDPGRKAHDSRSGLGRSAARGASIGFISQLARFSIQFGGIVVLGRLLLPDDYGLIAMVVAIVGLGEILRDVGLGAAAVQSEELNAIQKTMLFWTNLAVGSLLTVVTYILAGPISNLYDDPRIARIVEVLSITFLINGISAQFRAQLVRHLRFGLIASVEVIGSGLSLALAVGLAIGGLGYWALVLQQLVQAAIFLIGFVILSRWWPGLPARGSNISAQLKFGVGFMATQVLVYISSNISSVIIGSKFGAADIGYYNRAFQLCSLPLNQITAPATNVSLATLSRIQRDEDRFMRFVKRGQLVLSTVVISCYVMAFVAAESIVRIVLGQAWIPVTPILRALVVGGIFQSLGFTAYWIFTAKGWTGSNFRFAIVTRMILILLVVVGASQGPVEAAIYYSAGVVIVWPAGLLWLRYVHGVQVLDLFLSGVRTVGAYSVAGVYAYMVTSSIDSPLPQLLVTALVMISVSGLFYLVFPHFRKDVQALVDTAKLVRSRPVDGTN